MVHTTSLLLRIKYQPQSRLEHRISSRLTVSRYIYRYTIIVLLSLTLIYIIARYLVLTYPPSTYNLNYMILIIKTSEI